ncbi:MAG: hypothetical protein K1X75_00760 [Leptospirales bacterium]|nr:hypothetical protein [Leptospirales bacterium]
MLRRPAEDDFWIIAHRGYSAAAPENTLFSCALAYRAGAPAVEIDLTLTRDGRLIVLHDDILDRTTSGRGPAAESNFADIRKLEAGTWMASGFHGMRPPTPGEILRLARACGGVVNIEIKPECYRSTLIASQVCAEILQIIAARRMQDHVIVSSFEWRFLDLMRAANRDLALGLLLEAPVDDRLLDAWRQRFWPCSIHPELQRTSARLCSEARNRGMRVIPYTANSAAEILLARQLGASGVFTNFPERARRMLQIVAAQDLPTEAANEAAEERMLRERALQSWTQRHKRV